MKKIICFDMDGTIADLYNVNNWLEDLRAERHEPFEKARPMVDIRELNKVNEELEKQGWEIRIITWLPIDANQEFKARVRKAKREWVDKHGFKVSKIHVLAYGTTKANPIRKEVEKAILVDDNDKVRQGWSLGETINPVNTNIIEELKRLARA